MEKRHGMPFPGSGHLEAVEDNLSMRYAILLALDAQLLHWESDTHNYIYVLQHNYREFQVVLQRRTTAAEL